MSQLFHYYVTTISAEKPHTQSLQAQAKQGQVDERVSCRRAGKRSCAVGTGSKLDLRRYVASLHTCVSLLGFFAEKTLKTALCRF